MTILFAQGLQKLCPGGEGGSELCRFVRPLDPNFLSMGQYCCLVQGFKTPLCPRDKEKEESILWQHRLNSLLADFTYIAFKSKLILSW